MTGMERALMLAVFLVALGALAGCQRGNPANGNTIANSSSGSGQQGATPQSTLAKFKTSFEAFDAAGVEACYAPEAWKIEGRGMEKDFADYKREGSSVVVSWVDSDVLVIGETANVTITAKLKGKSGAELPLKLKLKMRKIGGQWKITK